MKFPAPFERKNSPVATATMGALSLKSVTEDGEFEGYASTFGNVDQGGDEVVKGAFMRTLRERKLPSIKCLRDHDTRQIVGQWLELREDDRGLWAKGRLFASGDGAISLAKETLTLLRAEAIDAMSIGYRTIKSAWDEARGVRQLLDVDLWEISLVPFPMNTLATVTGVKGDATERDIERILRDANVPSAFAKLVTLHGFAEATKRVGGRRDGDDGGKELAALINATADTMKGFHNA